jgi:exonuclease SbcD
MKVLHTSDLHLGHRLFDFSQAEEQELFLDFLLEIIDKEKIDILIISGDVFDTSTPSNNTLKTYYNFLINLKNTNCKNVIITAGNHDSINLLEAPKQLLSSLSIYVVAYPNQDNDIFEIKINNEKIIIAAVPFLKEQFIRQSVAGETFEEIEEKYHKAILGYYNKMAESCANKKQNNETIIATGHLFTRNAKVSDSEQPIYVGNLGSINANELPKIFDYIALGHLHKPQKVNEKTYYSGSPYILSFSEIDYDKKLLIFDSVEKDIKEICIPRFREFFKIEGNLEECLNKLEEINSKKYKLCPWVTIVLDETENIFEKIELLNNFSENLEILKIELKNQIKKAGLDATISSFENFKEISPLEVFKNKCKEEKIDLESENEILEAFNEILEMAKEGDYENK